MRKTKAILVSIFIFLTLIPVGFTGAADLTVGDFDFDIDAGNGTAAKISDNYFEITMVASDGSGARGWFGFNITQNAAGKTIELRCDQTYTEWSGTWCAPVYSEDHGATWSECDDIYFSGDMLYFEVTPTADSVLVFAAYPILYTRYEAWITTIDANENCTVTSDTVNGSEELYLITITESGASDDRPVLWLICGQDPPETWPQHIGIGMVEFLLSSTPDASRLRSDAIWKVVPVANPNAVRNGLIIWNKAAGGEEINLDWTAPSSSLEVIAMKSDIAAWHAAHPTQPIIILDMHSAMGAMTPQGSGIFGLNNKPNNTYAQLWADLVMAGTVYDDNPTVSPASQGSSRLRGYAQIIGAGGATLEIFQSHNIFDWGDLPDPVTVPDLYDVGESLSIALGDYSALWYTSEGEEPPPPPTGEKPKFTETINSWIIGSSGSWTDYNITSGEGVPKPSIAEVVMVNTNVTAARLIGVRTDGSGLDRYIDRCPVDTVGGAPVRMLVNVGTNGIIECYAEDYTDVMFYVTGYWQNTNYTEMFQQVSLTAETDGIDVWADINVNSLYGIPYNRTIGTIVVNDRTDGLRQAGVRTDGSAVNRMLDMERADTEGVNTWDTYVQSSPTTGIIEVQCELYTDNWLYLTGYFGRNLNFTEAWATKDISAGSWTNADLTAEIFNDTDIVDFSLCNVYTTAVVASHGVRIDGSGLTRVVPQGESIGGGPTGFGMSVNTDALGVVELYSSSLNEQFKYGGYFRGTRIEEEEPPPAEGIAKVMSAAVVDIGKIMGILWVSVAEVNGVLK